MKKMLSRVIVFGELMLLLYDAGAMNGNSMVDKGTQVDEIRQVQEVRAQSINKSRKSKTSLGKKWVNYAGAQDLVKLQKAVLRKISGQYGLDYNFSFGSFPDLICAPSIFRLGRCISPEVKTKTPLERVDCAIMKSELIISDLATKNLQKLGITQESAKMLGGALLIKTMEPHYDFLQLLTLKSGAYEKDSLNGAHSILKPIFSSGFVDSARALMEYADALNAIMEYCASDSNETTTDTPRLNKERVLLAVLEDEYSCDPLSTKTMSPIFSAIDDRLMKAESDLKKGELPVLKGMTRSELIDIATKRKSPSALETKWMKVLEKGDPKSFLNELSNAYVVHWGGVKQNTVDPAAKIRLKALLDMADSESLKLTGLGVSEWTANVMSSVYVLAHLDSINDLLMLLRLRPQSIYDETLVNRASEKLHYIFSDSFIRSLEGLVSLRQILNELGGEKFKSPKDILRTIDERLSNFDTEEEIGTMTEQEATEVTEK